MPLISSKNLGGGHWPHSAEEASCNPPADPHNACLSRTARRGFQQVMLKTDQQVWPSLVLLRPHCGPAHRLSHLHRSPRPSAKPRPPLLAGPFTQWAQDKAATRSQSQSESKRERSPDPMPGSPSRPETGRGASLVPGCFLVVQTQREGRRAEPRGRSTGNGLGTGKLRTHARSREHVARTWPCGRVVDDMAETQATPTLLHQATTWWASKYRLLGTGSDFKIRRF